MDSEITGYWDDSVSYTHTMEKYEDVELDSASEYSGRKFSIEYPQLHGLDPALEEEINTAIRERGMFWVEKMYLNPGEPMKELLAETEAERSLYLASEVECFITYNTEDLISVVFTDHYFIGSIFSEYSDIRTININLKTGEVGFLTEELIDVDEDLAQAWIKKASVNGDASEFLEHQPKEDFVGILSNEESFAGRYFSNFFFDGNKNINVAVSYHMNTGEFIARGWASEAFTVDELSVVGVEWVELIDQ